MSAAVLLSAVVAGGVFLASRTFAGPSRTLRVCADPNNLPFSNMRGEGFENGIAQLLARDLGETVSYVWFPQRRGFLRHTLRANLCDVVMGIPAGTEAMATTRPYYRSTYVFVTPRGRPPLTSFDDPRLPSLRIGIQLVGDDYQNPPAARALAARHLTNVRGFPVYGDYARAEPQREIVDAIATGDIDTAVVWGPIGGYFASRARVPMTVTPVSSADPQVGPVAFDIAIGVRPEDRERRAALDAALARRQADVQRILRSFAIPVVPLPD